MQKTTPPTALIILDGFGFSPEKRGNAVSQAQMPFWRSALKKYPSTLLKAAGKEVGILPELAGNSEVGHRTIGGGCITDTVLKKIHDSIKDGSLENHKLLNEKLSSLAKSSKKLHLMGLLSSSGVHSHEDHLYALLQIALKHKISKIIVHPFLDGRDTPPKSATEHLKRLEEFCVANSTVSIGSLHGRFYAMDRDKNWDRTEKSYLCLCGQAESKDNWKTAIEESYNKNITDEFVHPVLLKTGTHIENGDGLIFFNIRADRARQIHDAFANTDFGHFHKQISCNDLSFFITANKYHESNKMHCSETLFQHEPPCTSLVDEIVNQTGQKVFAVAETEKYAHVTYFFREATQNAPNPLIETTLIPSIKVMNYVKNPEMSAQKVTDAILKSLKDSSIRFYLANYANTDMVGHSGNFEATVKACECIDKQLKILHQKIVVELEGTMFVTADHGNAEEMLYKNSDNTKTSHTANPVPFVAMTGKSHNCPPPIPLEKIMPNLSLANIAATVLSHMKLKIPEKMEQEIIFPCLKKES
ncbi:2,3-bisphosphoglycerate-independent phosphoglycerate mutase [Candidatus Dependentiae bacterium]